MTTENPYTKPGNNYTLEALNELRLDAKERENQAKKDRVAIEEAMIAHDDMPELLETGVVTVEGVCKVTTKYSRKWDQAKLAVLRAAEGVTDANWPFKVEFKENATSMKYLRENYPDYVTNIENTALTLTPSKPAFTEAKK